METPSVELSTNCVGSKSDVDSAASAVIEFAFSEVV
jgi:hypothetical protein